MSNFYIYKYVENNEIVYIGQTVNLLNRINQHKTDKLKGLNNIWFFECNNKTEMDSYEYFLIQKYRPKLNVIYNKSYQLNDNELLLKNFIEPSWKFFTEASIKPRKKEKSKEKKKTVKNLNFNIFKKEILENINNFYPNDIKIDLSLIEQRMVIFSIFNNNIFNKKEYLNFNHFTSGKHYLTTNNAIETLLKKNIFIQNQDEYLLNTNILKIKLPYDYLKIIFNCSTKYFFPILNATYNKEKNEFFIPVTWLLKNSDYQNTKSVNARIIKPICDTLELHKVNYSLKTEKEGRSYKAFIISIND